MGTVDINTIILLIALVGVFVAIYTQISNQTKRFEDKFYAVNDKFETINDKFDAVNKRN